MAETIDELVGLIENLKKDITKNQNLANEVSDIVENLKRWLDETNPGIIRMEMADVIQRILEDEPDAKLRPKLQRLVEMIRRENGNITADEITIKMLIC